MSKKRDMYVSRKDAYSGKRRGRNRRKKPDKLKPVIAVIMVLAVIGIGGGAAFYLTGGRLVPWQETPITRPDQNAPGTESAKTELVRNTETDIHSNTGSETGNAAGNNMDSQAGTITNGAVSDGGIQESDNQQITNDNGTGLSDTGDENNITDININTSENTDSDGDMQETFKSGISKRSPIKVKGIYVTGPKAGNESYMKELTDLVDTTELNAMVIDIKNDNGEITYKMDLPEAKELKADVNYISDIQNLISELKEKDIYLIARVVAFKDPILAKGRPDLCLKKKDGSIFYDKSGLSWVNPYKKDVWEYLISVAREAALLGFDEIQFDYIRFSTDSGMSEVDFGKAAAKKSKMEVISEFTKYACDNLKPLGVYVSADVYGTIIDSSVDANIVGQDYKEMAKYLDYICPMIYPSHYQDGSYGIKHPDLEPYELILKALDKSQAALGVEEENTAVVRSWLQDFTATWLKQHISYGPDEIRAQIQAVYDAGYEEWILWNGNNNYTIEGLEKNNEN